jgi:hypothetical protein
MQKDKYTNKARIIVDKSLKDEVVEVKRIGDRIIRIKTIVGKETFNVISAYAP